MADATAIPVYRCTSCLQAIPEDRDQYLFGSDMLRPKSDEADNFAAEAQNIIRYANVVAIRCRGIERIGEEVV